MSKPKYEPITDEEAEEVIGTGVHTGLRKGSSAPSANDLWQAILLSEDSAWSDAVKYCVDCLHIMGLVVCREVKP